MRMIAVSVIIPVFNSAKYLTKCIDSLLAQSLKNCEFVFINDGSSDASVSIIEEYQKKDNRIVLFNQENKGVSAARNKGIELAEGECIGFVDADDFVETDMFQKLHELLKSQNTDIVIAEYFKEVDGESFRIRSRFETGKRLDKNEISQKIIPEFIKGSTLNSCCNKLYKASVIKEIPFPVGVALGEDGLFNLKAFDNSDHIVFSDYCGYHYQEVAGSATRNSTDKNYFNRSLEVFATNYQALVSSGLDNEKVFEWKSIRLIDNVISYIHIYLKPGGNLSFLEKTQYVKAMILNPIVQKSVHDYYSEIQKGKTKYQQFIVNCIKNKSLIKLILVNKYIQYRNS